MPRTQFAYLTDTEVDELRSLYRELVQASEEERGYRPKDPLNFIGGDILELTRMLDQSVLGVNIERLLGIAATPTLERYLKTCAQRQIGFNEMLDALLRWRGR